MPAVVGDIKWFLACRCIRHDVLYGVGVDAVVAGREVAVATDEVESTLSLHEHAGNVKIKQ